MGCLRFSYYPRFELLKGGFQKELTPKKSVLTLRSTYIYGFNGMEMDDEVKNSQGTSYDFGNRTYDPRVGRFLSRDGFANKFASQSPYVFAGNMPIWAKDVKGDSVLFYSESGTYLGYSHDNTRYKDKNLLVIINDKGVDNFKNQYALKRNADYSSPEAREANVAGLEGMGKSIDVTDLAKFTQEHNGKVLENGKLVPAPNTYDGENEFGAFMVLGKNKVNGKTNMVTLDANSAEEGMNTNVFIPSNSPKNTVGWFHTHTNTSKGISFSKNDRDVMSHRAYSSQSDIIFAVGTYDEKKQMFISIAKYNGIGSSSASDTKGGTIVVLDSNSFKDAKP